MRRLFVLSFSSFLVCFSAISLADKASVDVDSAILKMHQEIKHLANENTALKNQIELLQEAQKISNQQISELFKMLEIKATNQVIEKVVVSQKENEDRAAALYADGRKQLIFGDHDTAITLFNDYLKNYSGYKNTPDAQYWLGRALYAQKSYTEAKAIFVQFQQQNPLHSKLANSMYELAQALIELNEIKTAKEMLSKMIEKFPTHNLRNQAENKLKDLQAQTSE